MALFDIFKKKEKKVEKKEIKKEEPKKAVKKAVKKEVKEEPKKAPKKRVKKAEQVPLKPKKVSGAAYRILKGPHVTEKATDLTRLNQYVFNVYPRANKPEIKKTIEDIYGVDVVSLKIIKIHPKKRRLGRIEGWRKGYKKAIVKIKEGQKIEVLPR